MVKSNQDQSLYCRTFEPRGYQERIYNHNEHTESKKTDDETHQINHTSFCSPFETGGERDNMNLGTDIIKKTIDFCIRGPNNKSSNYWNKAKLQRGKYKYHILKELLVNILQYTEIIDISYKNKLEIQNKIDEAIASAAGPDEKNILLEEAFKADMHVETGPVQSNLSFEKLKEHIQQEINQWEINIGDNFYVSQKIIDSGSEKYYRATVVSIDPDPREYNADGVYKIKKIIRSNEEWVRTLKNSWKDIETVRWNKEDNKLHSKNIKYTIQFQGHFSQYWNELAEKEKKSNLKIITTWEEESKSKFENMRKDKLSKESAE